MSNAGIASLPRSPFQAESGRLREAAGIIRQGLAKSLPDCMRLMEGFMHSEMMELLIRPERQKNPYAAGQFVEIAGKTYFVYFNGEVEQNKPLWLFGQDEQDGEAYWYYYLNEEDGYCKGSSKGIGNKNKKTVYV